MRETSCLECSRKYEIDGEEFMSNFFCPECLPKVKKEIKQMPVRDQLLLNTILPLVDCGESG